MNLLILLIIVGWWFLGRSYFSDFLSSKIQIPNIIKWVIYPFIPFVVIGILFSTIMKSFFIYMIKTA
jgi:hypothetical protein